MADLSEVLESLQNTLVGSLYPNGATAGQAVTGFDVIVGIGWPDDAELERALRQGRAFVSIYPLDGERNVTEWEYEDTAVPRANVGINATYSPDTLTATFTGVALINDVIGVVYNNVGYHVKPTTGDTGAEVAALVAAVLPNSAGMVSGGTFVFNYNPKISVIASSDGLSQEYIGRIERRVQVSTWAFDQAARDKLFAVLQRAVMRSRFLQIPIANSGETEQASISFSSSSWTDKAQNVDGYMRSLIALVSFSITAYNAVHAILFTNGTINDTAFGPTPPNTAMPNGLLFNGVPLTYADTPLVYIG